MNFSASMAISILLHSAVAIVVIAAPPSEEQPVRMLDEFVEARQVTFQPQGLAPTEEPAPKPEPAVEKPKPEAPEEEPDPPEEPEPRQPEPEPAPEKPAEEPPENPEDKTEPTPEPEKAELKPVVAARDSESAAEVRDAASAQGGVSEGRPDGEEHPGARASGREDRSAGTPRPVESGSDGVDRRALLRAWLKKIYVRVFKHQRYPRAAQRAGHQGKVVLKVWVTPAGKVKRAEVAESSGHMTLDRAALQLLRRLDPLPKPPDALGWKTRPIKVPVTYRLR